MAVALQTLELTLDDYEIQSSAVFSSQWPIDTLQLFNKRLTEFYIDQIKWFQDLIIPNLPRGVSGLLKISYAGTEIDFKGKGVDIQAIFGSDSPYAKYIEEGTKPHFPPPGSLDLYVHRIMHVPIDQSAGVAFVVARKIAKEGTKAQLTVSKVVDDNLTIYYERFESAVVNMLEEAVRMNT